MDSLSGKRRDIVRIMEPGEYGKIEGDWHACTPNGLLANLRTHDVVENADGTITVQTHIEVVRGAGSSMIYWKGYLRQGVFETISDHFESR